jgi:hypothetical protein
MATTTNFGWETPDDTDLVKDGAAAIRTALGGVDTSFVDLKGGTTGQVLAKASNTDLDFVWSADAAGMTNPMTTTGDIIYSSSGSTPARRAIGTTGQVLTVSGGVPTWATASSGSMTELASGSMTGTKVSLNSISSGYKNLVLIVRDFYSSANAYMGLTVNNTTGIYAFTGTTSGDNPMTSTYQNRQVEYLNSQTDNFLIVTYFDYASSGSYKTAYEQSIYGHLYNANQWNLTTAGDFIRTTSAISSIEMNSTSGSFSAGNYVLFGVK